jgi:acyl-coenzyme A thioesterase PaaI-like protein
VSTAPEGFAPHFRKSPVTEPWEPLYSKTSADGVEIGLTIAPEHCNSRGFLHGGVIAALADNAMGLSFGEVRTAKHGRARKAAG